MDVLEAIHKRRSIRSFTDQSVPDEVLHQILGSRNLGAQRR